MKEIKVSIIIPCYNDGEYLLEAIESVRKYKEKNYEIIIINDGSKDKKTLKTLKDLKKQKNIILINQKHQGPSTARNNGIKKSKAEYIFFLDADNKIEPEYLKQGLKILDKNKEIGIVYSDVKFFGEEERIINLPEFNFERLLFKNYIDTCAMVRKQVWKDVKGFDTKLDKYTWEDWIFCINAYKKGWKFYHIPKVLLYYRVKKQ